MLKKMIFIILLSTNVFADTETEKYYGDLLNSTKNMNNKEKVEFWKNAKNSSLSDDGEYESTNGYLIIKSYGLKEGIKYLESNLETYKTNRGYVSLLASKYLGVNKINKAQKLVKYLRETFPDKGDGFLLQSNIYLKEKKYEKALAAANESRYIYTLYKDSNSHHLIDMIQCDYKRAEACFGLEDYEASSNICHDYLIINPEFITRLLPGMMELFIKSCIKINDLESAKTMYEYTIKKYRSEFIDMHIKPLRAEIYKRLEEAAPESLNNRFGLHLTYDNESNDKNGKA